MAVGFFRAMGIIPAMVPKAVMNTGRKVVRTLSRAASKGDSSLQLMVIMASAGKESDPRESMPGSGKEQPWHAPFSGCFPVP